MKSFFSVVWMIVGGIGLFILNGAMGWFLSEAGIGNIGMWAMTVILCLVTVILYHLVMRLLVRRSTPEIAVRGSWREALLGILAGVILFGASVTIIVAMGGYSFEWIKDADTGAIVQSTLRAALNVAVLEELVFRGFLFQAVQRMGGQWLALAFTSLFFGAAHLGNPGATLWSAFAIAVEAGVLLGAAYLWRRNLWFAIGLHFAWNAIVALMGIPVSGNEASGLFRVDMRGADLLTGGAFGIEGSVVVVAISLLISVPMLVAAARSQPRAAAHDRMTLI